jgi:hypothetical protein
MVLHGRSGRSGRVQGGEAVSESSLPATQVQLDGEGPFLLPFLGADVSFGVGDHVAVMRTRTVEGQEVLLPFEKETLRAIGVALADTLK